MAYGQINGKKISGMCSDDAFAMVQSGEWTANDFHAYVHYLTSESFSDGYSQGSSDADMGDNQ